jgi:hypothetical protein
VLPLDCQEEIPPGTNGQLDSEGDGSSWRIGVRALDTQWNPVRRRNQLGSTAHQIGKNPGLNSGLPQEAEGETDHLPETLVTACWGETVSLRFREQGGRIVPCEST